MTTNSQPSKFKPSTSTTHDITTLLNRTSVALARSQRLVDSWLPAAPSTANNAEDPAQPAPQIPAQHTTANDSDLQALLAQVGRSDKAGLGYVDPAGPGANGGVNTRGGESELDRLRKQMLGRKGAKLQVQAQAQAQRGGRGGMLGVGRGGSAGVGVNGGVGKRRDREEGNGGMDESDDEGGRSAAFKSKRRKGFVGGGGAAAAAVAVGPVETREDELDHGEADENRNTTTAEVPTPKLQVQVEDAQEDGDDVEEQNAERSSKKPTSYLDEVLSQRKKKKKKNKNKNKANTETAVGAASAVAG